MEVRLTPIERELPPPLRGAVEAGMLTDYSLFDARIDSRLYSVIQSRDNIGGRLPDWRWHVSVAGTDNVPRWADLVAIGHEIRPGVCFVVGVPPRSWWINVHPHCLHLWELGDENLMAQWRSERMGAVPT